MGREVEEKEATQHNLIWTLCGLILLSFFLALLLSKMLQIHQNSSGNSENKGAL